MASLVKHRVHLLNLQFIRLCFIAVFACSFPTLATAEVFYKWQDQSGHWVYGAHPPAGVDAIAVTTTTGSSKPTAVANKATNQNAGNEGEENSNSAAGGELFVETRVEKSKAEKRKLCEAAKGNLDALSSSAVIRRKDANGEVTVISEKERQAETDKAKLMRDKYC
jgi:hypothetical protein